MWEFIIDCLWIVWSFFKLIFIGVYSLFQDLYQEHKKPPALPPQHGRVAIVTGGSSGIGFHVTKTLCELGMHVIIASSNKKTIDSSIKSIKKQVPDAVLEGYELDLSSIKSVHKFAHDFKSRRLPLHILINNAGVMHIPYKKSFDGIEKHIAVNYMGHFLLTILLLPVLNVSGTNQLFARIVNISSSTHRVGNIDLTTFTSKGAKPTRYSPYAAYAQSKLAVIMGTYELARRLKAAKCFRVTVNCLHPGLVDSNLHSKAIFPAPLLRRLIGRFYKSPSQGADTVLYVALSPDLEKQSGGYYENCQKAASSKKSQSFQLQQAIWHTTCSVLSIDPHDLPSSRSHELMSNTGLAFSWHEDYMNSPYQTSVSSPDKNPAVISLDKAMPPLEKGEERKHPSDSCVIDFDKDGEPSPQDRIASSLEKMEPARHKDFLLVPHKRSDLNSKHHSDKKVHSSRKRSDSCKSEPILLHESAKENPTNTRKDSAPDIYISLYRSQKSLDLDPKQAGNLQCQEFMSTPTINNMPPSQSGKFRAVMCGNDIMYIPDDDDENSQGSLSPPSEASSPRTSISYISMEEGDLNPSVSIDDILRMKSARSNSSGILPCIHLNESMLESLQCEPDAADETSDFTFINEINQKSSPSKFTFFEKSPLHGQTEETSMKKTFLKDPPFTDYISPVISKEERQFDTPVPDMSGKIQNNPIPDISIDIKEYEDWRNQPLKSNSPGLRDSSDEESDDMHMPSGFGQTLKPRRPSISEDDDEEETRQERGRTMVRRSSRIRTPVKRVDMGSDDEDEVNTGLPYPGMTNITITVDQCENTCSSNTSPEKITPYQDNMILEFVNGIITESVKIVQRSKSPVPDEENPTNNEIIDSPIHEEASAASAPSVDEEIRMFMKEGNGKFQDSKSFTPSNTSSQEQKSNAFAQKGWDRLPQDISDAELKAFAEHTILYNEMIRSGRFTPMKSQLDTVREESVPDSNSQDTLLTDPPKTMPKPKPSAVQEARNTEHTPQDIPEATSIQSQSPKVKVLARDFEEKIQDLEKSPPVCPQNSPKSNSSDSDTANVKNISRSLQDIFPVSEGEYCHQTKLEAEKRESFSSGEERPGETESFSSSEGRPVEIESQQLPPGSGLSHLFFSDDISPTKDKTSDDMLFMFRLAPESFKKASIVEINDNEKSEANDILQGVPLLEEDDSDNEDQFQGPFSPEYLFRFKPKTDETSSKFTEESTDTSTKNLDSKNETTTDETPPVAKTPVKSAQGTLTPEKPPPIAKKPVRPQQDPPPVAKKPIRPDPSPIIPEKATEPKATMSPSESSPEKTTVNTVTDTETSGKCTVSSVIDSVSPKKLSDLTSPVQGLPSIRKPMQEPVSQEISVENQSSVSEEKSTVNELVNLGVESVRPVDKYVDPQKATDENKILASSLEPQAGPIKGDIPGEQEASPVKEHDVMDQVTSSVKTPDSSAEQVTNLGTELDSSVEQEFFVKEPDSFVEQPFGSVKGPDRLIEKTTSSVEELDCSVRDVINPVKEQDSPGNTSCPVVEPDCPVEQATSPEIEPDCPVEQATSPEIEPDCPVEQATSPEIEPDCSVEQATSPEIESDCLVEQSTSPEIEPDCPVEQATDTETEPDCSVKQTASSEIEPDCPVEQATSPEVEPDCPVEQATNPEIEPDCSVEEVTSLEIEPDCSVEQATSPEIEPDCPVEKATSPEIEPDCPVEQATGLLEPDFLLDSLMGQTTSSAKKPDSPENEPTSSVGQPEESVVQQVSPVNQGASSMSQTACTEKVQILPRKEPEKQPGNPECINNVSPINSTANSVSPKMATEQPENESPTTCQQNSSENSKGLQSTSDPCLTFIDSTGIDVRLESPKHVTLEGQTCSQSPTNKPLELLSQEEKRLSIDLTDQTDISDASNVSTYMPAMSSFESEDCWFDSQPDSLETDLLREDSDYERMMAAYKSGQIQNLSTEDDETGSNVTLHSDPLSASLSETKSQDGEENAKDSHSNC